MDAFNLIYKHTAAVQYLQIRHIVFDAKEAEDVLQETYLALYRNMDKIEPPSALVAYLNRLSYYLSKNMQRSTNRRQKRMTNLDTVDMDFLETVPSPAKEVERQDTAASIRSSLDLLDERERLVLIMHYYQQLSIKQIAFSMDLSLATVKRIHKSAKENLKLLLEKNGISSWAVVLPIFKKLLEEQGHELSVPNFKLPFSETPCEAVLSSAAAGNAGLLASAGGAAKGLVCSCLVGALVTVGCFVGVPRLFPAALNDRKPPSANIICAEGTLTTIEFQDGETGIEKSSIWCETASGETILPTSFEYVSVNGLSLPGGNKKGRAVFQLPPMDVTLYFSDRAGNKCSSVIQYR